MTKIKMTVINDNISRRGRTIHVLVDTDNSNINDLLGNPYTIRRTFGKNVTNKRIRNQMVSDVKAVISSLETRVKDEGLTGKIFETTL